MTSWLIFTSSLKCGSGPQMEPEEQRAISSGIYFDGLARTILHRINNESSIDAHIVIYMNAIL